LERCHLRRDGLDLHGRARCYFGTVRAPTARPDGRSKFAWALLVYEGPANQRLELSGNLVMPQSAQLNAPQNVRFNVRPAVAVPERPERRIVRREHQEPAVIGDNALVSHELVIA